MVYVATYKLIAVDENGVTDEKEMINEEEIVKVTQCEAFINKRNSRCKCFVCQKEFNLQNDDENKQFYNTHSHQFTINNMEIYVCDEWAYADRDDREERAQ